MKPKHFGHSGTLSAIAYESTETPRWDLYAFRSRLAYCWSQCLARARFIPRRNNSLSVMRARKQGMFGIFEKIDSQYLQQASDTLIHYITLVSGGGH